MSDTYEYENEDGKNYKIILNIEETNFLHINIIYDLENDIYSSSYYIQNLKEKLFQFNILKTIQDFKNCCIENITKKNLLLNHLIKVLLIQYGKYSQMIIQKMKLLH